MLLYTSTPTQLQSAMKHTEVKLSLLVGNRRLCEFMANAGLGVTGIGSREIYMLTYAPGEIVDEVRIQTAIDKVSTRLEFINDEYKILSYEILEIKEVE